MARASKQAIVRVLLARHGRTYADEVGIRVERNTPAVLFQLLVLALLLSARIAAGHAVSAAKALRKAGLRTPRKMAEASWQDRVDVLTAHGYKRYDESTSRMLGESATLLVERWGGDLRCLREEAGRDVGREHALLRTFKGIGRVGADIFLREVQGAWDEVFPYADDRVRRAAGRLGLGSSPKALATLVARADFARLTSALVRVDLGDDYDEVRALAG